MTEVLDGYYYTKTHEWVKKEDGSRAKIGLTDHAQEQLTDIAYVELPEVGEEFSRGDELGVVESVKSSDEILSPLTGKVTDANTELEDSPEMINESPYEDGWLAEIAYTIEEEFDDLMNAEEYTSYLDSL